MPTVELTEGKTNSVGQLSIVTSSPDYLSSEGLIYLSPSTSWSGSISLKVVDNLNVIASRLILDSAVGGERESGLTH